MNIPKGHHSVIPYFIIENADNFKSYLEKVFNAEEAACQRDEAGRIRHGEMRINGSSVMFGESSNAWQPLTCSLFLYVENADQTYALSLKNGAKSLMEPADQSYGRSCGVKDPFGNVWWLTTV